MIKRMLLGIMEVANFVLNPNHTGSGARFVTDMSKTYLLFNFFMNGINVTLSA